jgi:hypothetical protein
VRYALVICSMTGNPAVMCGNRNIATDCLLAQFVAFVDTRKAFLLKPESGVHDALVLVLISRVQL